MSHDSNDATQPLPSGTVHSSNSYCCPYSCGYIAPTERQVRAHVTWADHGEHSDVNGFSVDVVVPDKEGGEHRFANKIQLDDITLEDITNEVTAAKQMIIKLAYENPHDATYAGIQETATSEGINCNYNTVRELIKQYVEYLPAKQDEIEENSKEDERVDTVETIEPFTGETSVQEVNPYSAAPNYFDDDTDNDGDDDPCAVDPVTDAMESESVTTEETDDTQNQHADESVIGDAFPYDTSTVADHWNETEQKIIATYQTMDRPTYNEVSNRLAEFDIDKSKSYVGNTLSGWKKCDYAELTAQQQRAVDLLVDKAESKSLQELADESDVKENQLKYARQFFPHIIKQNGGSINRQPVIDGPLPFELEDDLDDEEWSVLDRVIISAYHALEDPTDSDVHSKLADCNVDVSKSTIGATLAEYTDKDRRKQRLSAEEKTYEDLNDRQRAAVDALVKQPERTIRDIANYMNEDENYLYYINRDFTHIIESRQANRKVDRRVAISAE